MGKTREEAIQLNTGACVRITPENILGTKDRFAVLVPTLLQDLTIGDQIFINDGIVELVVTAVEPKDLVCTVRAGGIISARKGCNIPSTKVMVEILTDKDIADLKFIAKLDPEFVAASFVGSADDIYKIRKTLVDHGNSGIQIVAKIERPIAIQNIGEPALQVYSFATILFASA
jgi:pyruvate kinase